jgi:hypothetical protein
MRIDVHQHLLSDPLLAALSARDEPPLVAREDGAWWLHVPGEAPSEITPAQLDVDLRLTQLEAGGVDRALVALSSVLGVERLPAAEAAPLLAAYHAGAADLPAPFGAWGAVGLSDPDPGEIDALLDRGFAGVSLPAAALATPAAVERAGPLLERLERRHAPLFVHPGASSDPPHPAEPAWWPALTRYSAQMNAAWHAFLHAGRAAHPGLRVLFAMLAGGAPLHLERLAARGGPAAAAHDPHLFYDTSSYGPRAVDAVIRAVGIDQLVHGSDRPVAGAPWVPDDEAVRHALLSANPARLLHPAPVAA